MLHRHEEFLWSRLGETMGITEPETLQRRVLGQPKRWTVAPWMPAGPHNDKWLKFTYNGNGIQAVFAGRGFFFDMLELLWKQAISK